MQVINVTETAAQHISEIIASADKPVAGLRVGVRNSGCAGMAYTLDYVDEIVSGDDHVHAHGVDVYVDPKATLFLLGTVMDFEVTTFTSGFTFKNPNQTSACGCGESVELAPADLQQLADARAEAS